MSKKVKIIYRKIYKSKRFWFYVFTFPFIIGFLFFFLYPFIQAIIFSLSELRIAQQGYFLEYLGLDNYNYSLFIHSDFNRIFVETILGMISEIPLILIFSFTSAVVLNQKFKGRFLARLIFFLPVILGAGVVEMLEQTDYITNIHMEAGIEGAINLFDMETLNNIFNQLKFPEVLLEYILEVVNYIPQIIRASGIQILIFLAGLQSIPPSLYEAASMEGGTKWESFWLITLPMLSPLILTNIVYTVIDSFTAANNELVQLIRDSAFGGTGFGVSMAMSIMYFAVIAIILMIIVKIISRWVFYYE